MSLYWTGNTRKHKSYARKVDDRPPLSVGAAIALAVLGLAIGVVVIAVFVGLFGSADVIELAR